MSKTLIYLHMVTYINVKSKIQIKIYSTTGKYKFLSHKFMLCVNNTNSYITLTFSGYSVVNKTDF